MKDCERGHWERVREYVAAKRRSRIHWCCQGRAGSELLVRFPLRIEEAAGNAPDYLELVRRKGGLVEVHPQRVVVTSFLTAAGLFESSIQVGYGEIGKLCGEEQFAPLADKGFEVFCPPLRAGTIPWVIGWFVCSDGVHDPISQRGEIQRGSQGTVQSGRDLGTCLYAQGGHRQWSFGGALQAREVQARNAWKGYRHHGVSKFVYSRGAHIAAPVVGPS